MVEPWGKIKMLNLKMKKIVSKTNLLILIIVLSLFLSFFVSDSLADTGGGTGGIPNPIGTTSFTSLLERIIGYLVLIGAPILALMVLYGGFMILTAGGNPEKFKSGKDVILYAVIGYVIILVSWGVIYIIGEILGVPDLVNKI